MKNLATSKTSYNEYDSRCLRFNKFRLLRAIELYETMKSCDSYVKWTDDEKVSVVYNIYGRT